MLIDNHNRPIRYLRLAVTDRCNLRCQYCMPEEGIQYVDRQDLLSYEEMLRLISVLSDQGVSKVRITGGEPFLRKGLMDFLAMIKSNTNVHDLHITTNGTLNTDNVSELKAIGIDSVNLSLDSLDPERFKRITRRDDLNKVMITLQQLIKHQIKTKINMVVMNGQNTDDIASMIELTKNSPVSVRFLEEMPFNGTGTHDGLATWDHKTILSHITSLHPAVVAIPQPISSTAALYQIPGYVGDIGIIASYSRTFCGTCDRLRVTPTGSIKTCLYDAGVMNIRDIMRAGATDQEIVDAISSAISHRAKDGWEAEKGRLGNAITESMATIGG